MDGWMDGGNTVFLLRGAPPLILFLVGAVLSFMIQGPRLVGGRGQDEAAVTSPLLVSQRTSNQTCMRRWWGGGPATFSCPTLRLCTLLHSLRKKRSTSRAALPSELGELKVAALWSEEQSYIIYNISPTRHRLNKHPSFNAKLGETPSTLVQRRTFAWSFYKKPAYIFSLNSLFILASVFCSTALFHITEWRGKRYSFSTVGVQTQSCHLRNLLTTHLQDQILWGETTPNDSVYWKWGMFFFFNVPGKLLKRGTDLEFGLFCWEALHNFFVKTKNELHFRLKGMILYLFLDL